MPASIAKRSFEIPIFNSPSLVWVNYHSGTHFRFVPLNKQFPEIRIGRKNRLFANKWNEKGLSFVLTQQNLVMCAGIKCCIPRSDAVTFESGSDPDAKRRNGVPISCAFNVVLQLKQPLLSTRNDVFELEQREHKMHNEDVKR